MNNTKTDTNAAENVVQQAVVPPRPSGDKGLPRYYVHAYLTDDAEVQQSIAEFFERSEPFKDGWLKNYVIRRIRENGAEVADNASVTAATFFELGKVLRPPADDDRPLLAWEVSVYFVCHDVRFGGYGEGVFAWPEEPADGVLNDMCSLLMGDTLAQRGDGPSYVDYSDVKSRKVKPSSVQPTRYR